MKILQTVNCATAISLSVMPWGNAGKAVIFPGLHEPAWNTQHLCKLPNRNLSLMRFNLDEVLKRL
jgi:hypothetical protein